MEWSLRDEMTTILAIGFATEQTPGAIADRLLELIDRSTVPDRPGKTVTSFLELRDVGPNVTAATE